MKADDNVVAGMRRMGASEADIDAVRAQFEVDDAKAKEGIDFEVHEDCWESVMFFLAVQTQWVFRPVMTLKGSWSARSGLNYPGVESAARLAGIRRGQWAALFADLQVMELEVLEADAKAVR